MKSLCIISAIYFFGTFLSIHSAAADGDGRQFPKNATFTTLLTTPRAIEGLTGDHSGNLYVGGSGTAPCPIWKISLHSPSLNVIGNIPVALAATCAFSGIALDALNNVYQADGTAGRIYTFTPNAGSPPDATIFASGVPGTNGLAFDQDGNLWTGDGVTGQGRVWKITGAGANCAPPTPVNCVEVFRIQPMRNGTVLGGSVSGDGVGRQVRDFPPGTSTIIVSVGTMLPATITPAGGQDLVANGIAFDRKGTMFIIDTARGALWKVEIDRHGNLKSPTGCDSTFTSNTLCLSNVFVAHPILEGGDGIALDREGNIWVDANERNAVAVVTEEGEVREVFRNSANAAGSRNSADTAAGNTRILEFPTSPFLSGKIFCTSQSDGDRRDNSPRSAGEINAALGVGKISCMDQELKIPGLPLPVR